MWCDMWIQISLPVNEARLAQGHTGSFTRGRERVACRA